MPQPFTEHYCGGWMHGMDLFIITPRIYTFLGFSSSNALSGRERAFELLLVSYYFI